MSTEAKTLNVFAVWSLDTQSMAGTSSWRSGFFLSATGFNCLGGIKVSAAQSEDHALIWRARRSGISLRPARAPWLTNARNFSRGA